MVQMAQPSNEEGKLMRAVLVGYTGYWGEKLSRVLGTLGHDIVDWIDSNNEKKLESTDADVAIIATPPSTHYQLARRALNMGLDVLIEKPMAMKASQANDLLGLATKNGCVLSVDSTFVHTASFDFLASIAKPLISYQSLRLAPPMPQAQINAGWDLVCHDISILAALGYVRDNTPGVGIEDGSVATAALNLPTGGSAFITASRAWPEKVREIVLHYPGATYRWKLDGLYTAEGEPVVKETQEPLKRMIEDFAHRCQNRLLTGKTDGAHGATVVRCLERLFPDHSSLGVRPSRVGNGLYRYDSGKHISV